MNKPTRSEQLEWFIEWVVAKGIAIESGRVFMHPIVWEEIIYNTSEFPRYMVYHSLHGTTLIFPHGGFINELMRFQSDSPSGPSFNYSTIGVPNKTEKEKNG